ncbi:MAG: carboxylating nicotinate-nucleotide diphosphorylase [Acidobacteria bacterium]|nr:carboxylating nicotinate-nucleotide diphosphorylase [Acidobacteriota bacterium]
MPNKNNTNTDLAPLLPILYEEAVRRALLEDLGARGDITTDAIVSPEDTASARIIARERGRIAGIEIARHAFHSLDSNIRYEILRRDGDDVEAGDTLAHIQGAARPILTAERTALNFLSLLSGIATETRNIVAIVKPYAARVVCTRKTAPGLRGLEKYAVRAGGGSNHRFGLDDAVLIKDNHIVVAGGVAEAIRRARSHIGHLVKIEVEVDNLDQLEIALREKIDAVLLDNMPIQMLAEAVRIADKKAITEASGGITPENAGSIAATGVDLLSIGWITHSAAALDLALDLAFNL